MECQQTNPARRQLELISAVSRQITSILDRDVLLDVVVLTIHEALGYPLVHLFLVDPVSGNLIFQAGTEPVGSVLKAQRFSIPSGQQSIIAWVARHGEPLLTNDVRQEPRYLAHELLPDTRAELAVPLKMGSFVLGVLDVQSLRTNAFSDEDLFVLSTLADQVAVAVQNARLFDELREKERQLAYQIEHANDAIFNIDLDGRFTSFNEAAEEISGYRRQEVLGRPFTDLLCPEYHAGMLRLLHEGGPEQPGRTHELEFFHKSGQRVPIEISIATLRRDGRPVGALIIARDIRRRKQMEREILDFISQVSHELRTPLAAIVSSTEILLNYEEDPETRREFLNIIHQEAERLEEMIDEILDLRRMLEGDERGDQGLEIE